MSKVLVLNSGSSSLKYQVLAAPNAAADREAAAADWPVIAQGLIERIAEDRPGQIVHRDSGGKHVIELPIPDHAAAFAALATVFAQRGTPLDECGIVAVGHRVVHGGSEFISPVLLNDQNAEQILDLAKLAPLHNPGHYAAIVAARAALPQLPQVAVFDTAFHRTMPEAAYSYAVSPQLAAAQGIRRYGFHGISHQVVSRRAAALLGREITQLRQIVLHLGNGASMCAIDGGKSVDTSMGMTPLAGLMMGTRSGDIDPGVLLHLMRQGKTAAEIDELLNKQAGFAGFVGSNDYRDVRAAAQAGDERAQLAIAIYVQRVRHYLGAYLLLLGGADAIVFTAGLGENAADLRAKICADLENFGVLLDAELNDAKLSAARVISAAASQIKVLVVPTAEEGEIARQTLELLQEMSA